MSVAHADSTFPMAPIRWRKLGVLFRPQNRFDWMRTHAQNPVALQLDGPRHRIYFGTRDAEQRSHTGFIDVDLTDPFGSFEVSTRPALAPGPLGHFDDHGVYASAIVRLDKDRVRMYYAGWSPGSRRPLFYTAIGIAESTDGGATFERLSPAPILARDSSDPWMVSSPCVLRADDGWRMWYIAGIGWEEIDGVLESFYDVKYAVSSDGLDWSRTGFRCFPLQAGEKNIARPAILRTRNGFQAWLCVNSGRGYQVGYAESKDGVSWVRRDRDAGITTSQSGWDSEMMAYPYAFVYDGQRYLLYNGNGLGREGVGLAVEDRN